MFTRIAKSALLWTPMFLASGLNFVKIFYIATILSVNELGLYISYLGFALLFSGLSSFGLIEATVKRYPRLWNSGGIAEVGKNCKVVISCYTYRFIFIFLLILLLQLLFDIRQWFEPMMFGAMLAYLSGLLNLAASVIRASTRKKWLLIFTYTRTISSFALASIGASEFGWQGALLGECVAALIAISIAVALYVNMQRKSHENYYQTTADNEKSNVSGMILYFALLCSSVILFSDKGIISLGVGSVATANYGIVMTIAQIGQLTVNVITQRVGPLAIKQAMDGSQSFMTQMRFVVLPLIAVILMTSSAISMFFICKYYGYPSSIFERYNLSNVSIALAGAIGLTYIFVVLEFLLIARDRERYVLSSSALAVTIFLMLFSVGIYLSASVEYFLFSVFFSRVVQLVCLFGFMLKR